MTLALPGKLTPDPKPTQTPHADALRSALEHVTDVLDAAFADGLVIPPAAAQGAATLNIALLVVHGQELARLGRDPMEAVPSGASSLLDAFRG